MSQTINLRNFSFTPQGNQDFEIPSLVVRISRSIQGKDKLLAAFNDGLAFPYFGWNWDALEDCLRDLSWIAQRQVVIAHDGWPGLSASDLQTYLSILSDMVDHWAGDASKKIIATFPSSLEDQMRKQFSASAG